MRDLWKATAAALVVMLVGVAAQAQDSANSIVHTRNNGYRSVAVTPSNTPMLPTSAIFNGNSTACNIQMQLNGDSTTIVWNNVQAGEILPVQAVLIPSGSTTCTNLIALYDR